MWYNHCIKEKFVRAEVKMLLQRIKYFVTIVECNSFTEAAEQCYISQSAISQQISALEDELKVKLYKRDGRKFALTPAGEYFYKYGKKILRDIDEIKEETARIGSDEESNLSIGYLASYDGLELSRAISEFSKIYPEVKISVQKGTHEDLYDYLRSEKSLIVINDQRRAFSDEYENFILKQTPAFIEISPEHPLAALDNVTAADLEKYPCILVAGENREASERDFYEKTLGVGKIFDFAKSLDEARLMTLSGRGFMFVEKGGSTGASSLVAKEIKRIDGKPIVRTYCAFWKKSKANYYIEEFAAILRKMFAS